MKALDTRSQEMAYTVIQKMELATEAFAKNKSDFPKHIKQFSTLLQKAKTTVSDFNPAISVTYNNEQTSPLHIAHQKAEICPELASFEILIEKEFPEEVAICDMIDQEFSAPSSISEAELEELYADGNDSQPNFKANSEHIVAPQAPSAAPKKNTAKKQTYSTATAWTHYQRAQRRYEAR
jgi:hypothetical protein